MKHNITLTITSLLSIRFMALHPADDIVRGMEPGGLSNLGGVPSWPSGCTERWCSPNGVWGTSSSSSGRSVGRAFLSSTLMGAGLVGVRIANSSGVLFWVWTLTLGVTAIFSVILSARGLWTLHGASPGRPAHDSVPPALRSRRQLALIALGLDLSSR